ncbi:MAG: hypothetical protein HY067_22560 [Betaproteobacteria bacterium]|nr:hypothetical protein [Betaproteobacteria bacterium]
MRILAAVGMACMFVTACGMAEHAPVAGGDNLPHWAVDPGRPGRDIPAAGRSLFDFAVAGRIDGKPAYDVPLSFDELVRRLEHRLGCASNCSHQVLIPLGRSLQRMSASPDFFASPRVVVAITGDGAGPVSGRDRIYLGYQRRSNVIEVISYNETAGRFEFQLVKNYRRGATPQVVYANRNVCVACHQNHGPVFSRQVWDETNANPQVAAILSRAGQFHRIPVEIPNAIDDATDRANLIGVAQRMWIEACDAKCRKDALTAALQYRLSGERGFDREPVAEAIATGFRRRWPNGLAIPNPDIPNRDPLAFAAGTRGLAQSHVPAPLEAIAPRAPLEVWRAQDPELAHRFVTGLAQLLAGADVREIDGRLAAGPSAAASKEYRSSCTLGDAGTAYDCRGEVSLRGNASALDAIAIGNNAPLRNLTLSAIKRGPGVLEFRPGSGGHRARLANGNAIARVALRWRGAQGEAKVTVIEDFAKLREAVAALSLPDKPFSRTAVMAALDAALGLPAQARCCDDASSLPPAQADAAPATSLPPEATAFQQPCGACHATAEPSPPNFLAGDAQRISASLAHCAPRMFVRLAMWESKPEARDKMPMPPPQASRAGHPWMQDAPADAIKPLRNAVAGWLRAETGETPDLAKMLARGYENLRPCLPAGA